MSIDRIQTRSTTGEQYVHALTNAYRSGLRVWDPEYALAQDPDAWEKAKRDGVVGPAVEYRKHLVAGRNWHLIPASEGDPEDEKLALVVQGWLEQIRGFLGSRLLLSEALFLGTRYAQVSVKRKQLDVAGTGMRPWVVPTKLHDLNKWRFRQVARVHEGERVVSRERWSVERARWEAIDPKTPTIRVVYDDAEESLGYGRGLLDAIYYYLWAKAQLLQYGLDGAETWSKGILTAKIDGLRLADTTQTNNDVVQRYLTILEAMRSRHVAAFGKDDELNLLQGGGEGHQIVTNLIGYLDTAIVVAICGSNLPRTATQGGSFALAEVQENTTEALVQADRDVQSEALTNDLVRYLVRVNRPGLAAIGLRSGRCPRFEIVQEKREDPAEAMERLVKARRDAKLPILVQEAYEKTGFKAPKPGEAVLDPIETPDPFGGPPGAPGGKQDPFAPFMAALSDIKAEVKALAASRPAEAMLLAAAARPIRDDEEDDEVKREELARLLEAQRREAREEARADREAILAVVKAVGDRPAPVAAPAASPLSGLTLHVERAEFQAAKDQPQVFQMGEAHFAAQERNQELDRAVAASLAKVSASIAELAAREPKAPVVNMQAPAPPPAPKIVIPKDAIRVENHVTVDAEMRMPARKIEMTTSDGKRVTGEARDA